MEQFIESLLRIGPFGLSLLAAIGSGVVWWAKRRDATEIARLQAVTQSWQQVKEQLEQGQGREEALRREVKACEEAAEKMRVDFGIMARRIVQLEQENARLRGNSA